MNDKIDLTKVKPGDEVTVRAVVKGIEHGQALVSFAPDGPTILALTQGMIEAHHPKTLSVGDRVRCPKFKANDATGEVLAVRNHQVWVQFEGYLKPDTVLLSDLERI